MGKKEDRKAKRTAKKAATESSGDVTPEGGVSPATTKTSRHKKEKIVVNERTCTGEIASRNQSRDIKFISFSMSYYGETYIEDTTLELNHGRRYGLIGRNGSGKTTFLRGLAERDIAIPEHIDIYLLEKEVDPTNMTAIETVIDCAKTEVARLEALEENLLMQGEAAQGLLQDVYERLDELDPKTFEKRAGELLFGLGFGGAMMAKMTKDMSGGWRMRVALAQALFIKPELLLLDEPTNHLDLETCVWLEMYLATYEKILVVVSHSQDFLNGVCNEIMHLDTRKKLNYYGGNYATYCRTRKENEVAQMKQYVKQQEEIKDIKNFISSCGTYANLVRQAKSRQKLLDKMIDDGLIEKVPEEHAVNLEFPNPTALSPPVLALKEMGFAYDGNMKNCLYKNVDYGIDLDSRIVLLGPNGAGKSTLLKLFVGELSATEGDIQRHGHLKFGRYNQHSEEVLDMEASPIEFMRSEFAAMNLDVTEWRKRLGRYAITGKFQTKKIKTLSDGQRSQLVFCYIAQQEPHILLFDEPTNHLDMESIDALADAINKFKGGVVLVSHDFRLLELTAKEIMVCDNKTVKRFDGDIQKYKRQLIKNMKAYKAPDA